MTVEDDWWTSVLPHATHHPCAKLARLSRELFDEVHTYAEERAPTDLVRLALIHGDYTYANLLLSDDEHVVVLDWEKACYGPVLFDLARALFFTMCGNMSPPNISLIRPFLEGYGSISPMGAAEYRGLPGCMRVAASAFLLADIAQASPTRSPVSILDQRRQTYVDEFCLPRYQFIVSEWLDVVGAVRDLYDS